MELAKIPDIAVITNSLEVASTLRAARSDADILLLGGQVGADVPATYGEIALGQIERFHPDAAIISPVGLHPDHGATDYFLPEAEIARAMVVARIVSEVANFEADIVQAMPCGVNVRLIDRSLVEIEAGEF